ncbi:MAG: hypothetical protein ACC652_13130 [Acidimicrobiales bacterium]
MSEADFAALPLSVRKFTPQCPGCTQAAVTEEDARPCSSYDCPGLPVELQVTCNSCMYDFAAGDGQVKCDHDTCDTARRLQGNVETYRTWVHHIAAEAESAG